MSRCRYLIAVSLLCCAAPVHGDDALGVARPVVVPQVGVLQRNATPAVGLQRVTANVDVRGSTVTTRLDVQLGVKSKLPVPCDLLVPLPAGAELISVRPHGEASKEKSGFELLTGSSARRTLQRLAVNLNKAAVLEFYGSNLVLVRALAFSAGDDSVVQVRYRESATDLGTAAGYLLPRSERLGYATPWRVAASIQPARPVTTLYCASHPVQTNRTTNGTVIARVRGNATAEPGPFRLTWTTATGGVGGLVLAYPPRKGEDGFFLWLLQAPKRTPQPNPVKREITLVIDRSASMEGKRIAQVRKVANGVLDNLRPGESCNVITYNQRVDALSKAPLVRTADNVAAAKSYVKNIRPRGGSNIYDALKTSLAQPSAKGRLPIVLFFTDGLPTSGSPSEVKIRNLALKENPHRRRIYTVGIGVDLLSPLLNGLAAAGGGQAVFVLPNEDIAKKLAPVVDRLQHPVLTDAKIAFQTADGKDARKTFRDVMPSRLPDLYAGDQVVVLGRYRGTQRRTLSATGNYLGTPKSFRFPFDPKAASTANTFLPRLWASRRIGQLVETIRQNGAKAPASYAVRTQKPDPRIAKLSREVLELTARYGVMTEYTAFLSKGGKATSARYLTYHQLLENFDNRAVRNRSGIGSINQETNNTVQQGQVRLNGRNRYWNAEMKCVDVGTVQQVGTLALFRRGNRWIDGRLLIKDPRDLKKSLKSAGTIAFGSAPYWKLLDNLSSQRLQGVLALDGDVLLLHDGKPLLVTGPKAENTRTSPAANLKVK